MTDTATRVVHVGVGSSPVRPDGEAKVKGEFEYTSDLAADRMLWGATLRSPHAHARIISIDISGALDMAGVAAVLTQDDVPGRAGFGLEEADQPVLADDIVRHWGEPVAVVAAESSERARAAADAIKVEYEVLDPVVDPEIAEEADSVFRRMRIRRGDQTVEGEVVVEGFYEVAMQDQAPLGTESGLAVPDGEGGVDLYTPTQWVHADLEQIAACLNLSHEQVRVHPAGVGGAFGAREDVSLQIHLCMLALRTSRPVKMVYNREESFVGHVHRHPARMWYRHEADDDGRLVRVEARILLDGGSYASTSLAVLANASYFAVGPYRCDSVSVDGAAARTNNPPAGAMRGFGAVQSCFGYESQMDRLAAHLGIDPVEIRLRNALAPGDPNPTTGQIIETTLPSAEVLTSLQSLPLPDEETSDDPRHLPGGTGLTTPRSAVVTGVGYALSIKNLAFSEAFDDFADARIIMTDDGYEVETAAVEVGQGLVMVLGQIASEVLSSRHVTVTTVDTSRIGSAGSTSASRQTMMAGGAVLQAATELRDEILERFGGDVLDDQGVWLRGELVAPLTSVTAGGRIEREVRFRHPATERPDDDGQGAPHADFALAAHRAVVEVDPDLGLVRVVRIDTVQDVGKVLNPQSAVGQIEGGIAQGFGLAVMEELILEDGRMRNANFTDYLLPTFLDAPAIEALFVEEPSPWGPFGAKGIGEPPTISSTPAIVAAIRAATGKPLTRVPVRPEDIALGGATT